MHLTAITVCLEFGDYLAHTLPAMLRECDVTYVVTTPDDSETVHLVESAGQTSNNRLYLVRSASLAIRPGFRKAAAINDGLYASGYHADGEDRWAGWRLLVDADMYLAEGLKAIMLSGALDPSKLYGCPRHICPDYDSWLAYRRDGIVPESSARGTGWRRQHHRERGRYGSKGYFQLFHVGAPWLGEFPWVPTTSTNAGGYDREFYRKAEPHCATLDYWPIELNADYWSHVPANRFQDAGVDWHGRRSPRFERRE